MKDVMLSRRLVALLILVGILVGALLTGAMAFDGASVQAQSADGELGESEDDGANGAAEGPDIPITGSALDEASAAALDYIGEGRVTETEVGDEEGYYEVEITRDDDRQVDVHLDEAFNVLGHEND